MASTSTFPVSPPVTSRPKHLPARCCISPISSSAQYGITIRSSHFLRYSSKQRSFRTMCQASTMAPPPVEETKECSLPTWAEFELGRSPVYWKTMNGLPPTSEEDLTLFYNPSASKLSLNNEYGVAFNGGFNQPIMCGGDQPRVMTRRDRGEADLPFYTIKIRPPKHAVSLIFSFTNGVEWDGPYKLQFQVPKAWRNKTMEFFNEGLAGELSKEGACAEAIFPDSHVVIESCEIENLYYEGGDRCRLDLVPGCRDPNSPNYDPFANVDDGSCPTESDLDEE